MGIALIIPRDRLAAVVPPMNDETARVAVVLGAKNLGGAIAGHLIDSGWRVAAVAVARRPPTPRSSAAPSASPPTPRNPTTWPPRSSESVTNSAHPELIVNAVGASRPPANDRGGFGGRPIGDASMDGFHGWAMAVAEQAFVFLSAGIAALRQTGNGGALIQVTGGSSRRMCPGAVSGPPAARPPAQWSTRPLRRNASTASTWRS